MGNKRKVRCDLFEGGFCLLRKSSFISVLIFLCSVVFIRFLIIRLLIYYRSTGNKEGQRKCSFSNKEIDTNSRFLQSSNLKSSVASTPSRVCNYYFMSNSLDFKVENIVCGFDIRCSTFS